MTTADEGSGMYWPDTVDGYQFVDLAKFNDYVDYDTVFEDSSFVSYYGLTRKQTSSGNFWSGIRQFCMMIRSMVGS